MSIPSQLKNMRFNRVKFKEKRAFETGWQNKSYSYEEIQNYFPKENYGVLCGKELRVLDDDSKDKRLLNLFLKNFGETFRVRDHLYFKFDNDEEKKIIFYDNGEHLGELQGEGQYVVGGGSTHPSGEIYEVKNDLEIKTISYEKFKEVFGKYLTNQSSNKTQDIKFNSYDDSFIKSVKEKWTEGNRQDLAMSISGYLRKEKRLGLNSALAIVESICQDCEDNEVNMRLSAVRSTYAKDESEIKGYSGLVEKNVIVEGVNVEDFLIITYNKKGEETSRIVNIDKVAEYIENKFSIRTIFGIREETIEIYDEGVWSVKGRGVIKAEVERLLGVYSKNNVVIEVLEKIKRRTEISREEADIIPDYKRCILNGVLDLEDVNNIKFLPHLKEYNFRNKFPMDYNPNAQCPKTIEFMKQTFYEEDVLKIQEWLGFHLIRRYAFKRAVIIHGAKNTGKSVFLNLLNIFVNHNVSGLSLQEMAKGKPFDLLVLKDRDANIHDDMSSRDMQCVGGFKMAVGDGFISAEQKFGDKIRFRNTAKDTNACNKIPSSSEDVDDEAYYERILLIPADNVIPKELQNKSLIDELTTPEELSGLLNWSLEGYKRLVTQNSFSFEKNPEETKYLMIKNGNSLAEFSAEVLIDSAGDKITKDDLYKIYCDWCLNHKPKLSPDSKDKVGKSLIKFNPFLQSESNGKARYWLNVKITDSYYTFQKNIRNIRESIKEHNNASQNNIYVFSKPVIAVSDNQLQNLEKVSEEPINPELKDIPLCPKCNSPMIENKCISGCNK